MDHRAKADLATPAAGREVHAPAGLGRWRCSLGTEVAWGALRREFPIFERARYLAACSHAPLCTRVDAALNIFMESWRSQGNPWESDWMPTVARVAEKFARLVGAPPGSIGLNASV